MHMHAEVKGLILSNLFYFMAVAYLSSLLADNGVTVTRLARGLPSGSVLEFANNQMLGLDPSDSPATWRRWCAEQDPSEHIDR